MDSTFSRATMGFVVLTAGLLAMCYVALWALEAYVGTGWWAGMASLAVVVIGLGAEICIYTSTLHDPISDWIREPKRLADEAAAEARRNKK